MSNWKTEIPVYSIKVTMGDVEIEITTSKDVLQGERFEMVDRLTEKAKEMYDAMSYEDIEETDDGDV